MNILLIDPRFSKVTIFMPGRHNDHRVLDVRGAWSHLNDSHCFLVHLAHVSADLAERVHCELESASHFLLSCSYPAFASIKQQEPNPVHLFCTVIARDEPPKRPLFVNPLLFEATGTITLPEPITFTSVIGAGGPAHVLEAQTISRDCRTSVVSPGHGRDNDWRDHYLDVDSLSSVIYRDNIASKHLDPTFTRCNLLESLQRSRVNISASTYAACGPIAAPRLGMLVYVSAGGGKSSMFLELVKRSLFEPIPVIRDLCKQQTAWPQLLRKAATNRDSGASVSLFEEMSKDCVYEKVNHFQIESQSDTALCGNHPEPPEAEQNSSFKTWNWFYDRKRMSGGFQFSIRYGCAPREDTGVSEFRLLAQTFREALVRWLAANYPHLYVVPVSCIDDIISRSFPTDHLCVVNAVSLRCKPEAPSLPRPERRYKSGLLRGPRYSVQLMPSATTLDPARKEDDQITIPSRLKRTPACPPLKRFEQAVETGWSAQESLHIEGCHICQLTYDAQQDALDESDDDDPSFSTGNKEIDQTLHALLNGTYEDDDSDQ